jgi:aminoglycoside phosphotransferase (APT) family kinase protein
MQTGELLGSGRSADVFAIDDQWVLRRYRDGGDVTPETAVMSYLADHGYPVPRVRPTAGEGGRPALRTDLVMRRLSGPSMRQGLEQGTLTAWEAGTMLADLLRRLHSIPARVSADPACRVLHLDLHPENVMLTRQGPTVIDWRTTEEALPGLDWGMSALILAQVALGATAEAAGAREVLAALLGRRGPAVVLDGAEAGCLVQAKVRRAADPNMSETETDLLDDAVTLVLELASRNRC